MEISLKMDCKVEGEDLKVRYVLTNQGKYPLLCYDGAPGVPPEAEWPDLKGQLYVSVVGDLLMLKRIVAPIPEDVNVNRMFIPPLSQVMPGESRAVRFLLKQPVTERSEFTPDYSGAPYREHLVSKVELDIGCFWRQEGMDLIPFAANPKAFRLKSDHGPQSVISAQAQATVHVKERTDAAFRRL